jgi:polyisoprenoid-binding protein YceI
MILRKNLTLISLFLIAGAAQAATYVPVQADSAKSGLTFAIKYTAGVHEGITSVAKGEIEIDPTKLEITSGAISFPLSSLDSGNTKRNCHTFESLGVDYTHSVYPKDHICGDANTLPATGPDSIAFPTITFTFHSVATTAGSVNGIFSMHGVEKELTVPLTITALEGGKLEVKSSFLVHLPDFGVVVKKFLFVTCADDASVGVDLILQPKSAKATP